MTWYDPITPFMARWIFQRETREERIEWLEAISRDTLRESRKAKQ